MTVYLPRVMTVRGVSSFVDFAEIVRPSLVFLEWPVRSSVVDSKKALGGYTEIDLQVVVRLSHLHLESSTGHQDLFAPTFIANHHVLLGSRGPQVAVVVLLRPIL